MTCPVMESWARTAQINSAMSSAVEILCNGRLPLSRYIFSSSPDHHLVEIAAGAMQFTRISGAKARASDFVRQWTAAFEAAYGNEDPDPVMPAILPILRIEHPVCVFMNGTTARVQ